MLFQLSYRRKGIHGISGKSAHAFCDDKVNFPIQSILYHLIETITMLGVCCTDSLVRIYLYEFPFAVLFDVFCVIIHLCSIGSLLFFLFRKKIMAGVSRGGIKG